MEEISQALSIGIDWIIFAIETIGSIITEWDAPDWSIFFTTILAYIILIIDIYIYDGVSQSFFTWLLWGMLDSIMLVISWMEKADDLPIIMANVAGSLLTSISLLLVGNAKWGKNETNTLLFIVATLVLWYWSGSNILGISLAVAAEVIAGIPEMRASWKTPGSRLTLVSYLIFIICYSLSTIYSKSYAIENLLFPITFLIYCLADTYPLVKKWVLVRY